MRMVVRGDQGGESEEPNTCFQTIADSMEAILKRVESAMHHYA
jgi:hypothetical protein